MIDSYTATTVIIGFLITFGLLLPILDKIPKVRSIISFRWTLVVIYSAMCLGVIIDFEHLDTSVRFLVVLGGIILSAIFVFVRSYEKAQINHWKIPHARASLSKGDVQAELSLSSKMKSSVNPAIDDTKIEEYLYRKKREQDLSKLFDRSFSEEITDSTNSSQELIERLQQEEMK